MARNTRREWTVEDYDTLTAATKSFESVAEAADEEGGPSLSLVPKPERGEVWPTDLLPPAEPDPDAEPVAAMPFDGVELPDSRKRLAGWSAERQRLFLENLAETGSVHLAAASARLTARSTAAPSRSGTKASWSPRSACRATGC